MKINSSAVAPRILGSRGTPSKFVLYVLKDMYAKFGAFTRFVTIFVNFDANGLDYTSRYKAKAVLFRILFSSMNCVQPFQFAIIYCSFEKTNGS